MHERPATPRLRRLATPGLTSADVAALRALMDDAFGAEEEERFTDDDWQHALGGVHFVLDLDGEIVGHASVVERELHVGGRPVRTGYVEAVATSPTRHGQGLGSMLVRAFSDWIRDHYELGALGTGRHSFYARLGWQMWRGPSSVRTEGGEMRTPDDDGSIMVLPTPHSPRLDLASTISCEWRPGDVW